MLGSDRQKVKELTILTAAEKGILPINSALILIVILPVNKLQAGCIETANKKRADSDPRVGKRENTTPSREREVVVVWLLCAVATE